MASRRCSDCDQKWPNSGRYAHCPTCGELTTYEVWTSPMANKTATKLADEADARRAEARAIEDERKRKYDEFEKHCAERDERLVEEFRGQLDSPALLVWVELPSNK